MLGRVALLHYEYGLTHQEIGDMLGLSRVKVTRMLADARTSGLVEIRVHSDERPFLALEAELVSTYGLSAAWVAPTGNSPQRSRDALAAAAAQCLTGVLSAATRVAIGTSASLAVIPPHLPLNGDSTVEFIPLLGSRAGFANPVNPHELALAFGSRFAGRVRSLPAPLLAASASAAAVVRAEPAVAQTLDLAAAAGVLLVGIGGTAAGSGLLVGALTEDEYAEICGAGAVGDLSARFFDRDGQAVTCGIDDRIIGLTLAQLTAIPTRVAVAAGAVKINAIAVALTAGLINVLVTDAASATALLERSRLLASLPAAGSRPLSLG